MSTSGYQQVLGADEVDVELRSMVSRSNDEFIQHLPLANERKPNQDVTTKIFYVVAALSIFFVIQSMIFPSRHSVPVNSRLFQTSRLHNDFLKEVSNEELHSRGFSEADLKSRVYGSPAVHTESVRTSSGSPLATGKAGVHPKQEFQSILGFGGAFTESASYNYYYLSAENKQNILDLYFGEDSIGYTMARLPINSCDFSLESYNFDPVSQDYDLVYFDNNVTHDTLMMIPFIKDAMEAIAKGPHSDTRLRILATPWSPPAWMKISVDGVQSMLGSASPNGLIQSSQIMTSWANYISKFISAYAAKGVPIWAVTPQNEPLFAAPWEACSYTSQSSSTFISEFLGPILRSNHPEVKILGYDHNKDQLYNWTEILMGLDYQGYISGIAFHWYGYTGDRMLDGTYGYNNIVNSYNWKPNMILLGTEGCSCPGVSIDSDESWQRAERFAHDVIYDLRAYAQGWIDWNLLLDFQGGPNHLNNFCDAPITTSEDYTSFSIHPKFYYMGHISKFFAPGGKRVGSSIIGDFYYKSMDPNVVSGLELGIYPCERSSRQMWSFNSENYLQLSTIVSDTNTDDGLTVRNISHSTYMCIALGDSVRSYLTITSCETEDTSDLLLLSLPQTMGLIQAVNQEGCLGIVEMDDNANSGESGALVELVTCNSLDITQLWLVVPTPPDGTSYELQPLFYSRMVARYNNQDRSQCLTAGWPYLYGVASKNIKGDISLVVHNEAPVDVTLSYTDDDGKSYIQYGVGAKSLSTFVVEKS